MLLRGRAPTGKKALSTISPPRRRPPPPTVSACEMTSHPATALDDVAPVAKPATTATAATPEPLRRIILLNTILAFCCTSIHRTLDLRLVSKTFLECVEGYAGDVWRFFATDKDLCCRIFFRACRDDRLNWVIRYLVDRGGLSQETVGRQQMRTRIHDATFDKYGRDATPVLVASAADARKNVQLLIERGFDCTTSLPGGNTALILACCAGNDAIVELLLRTCCSTASAVGSRGWSPLHFAAFNGHLACVKLLCGTEAVDKNARSESGTTALHMCCQMSHRVDCVRLLLSYADVDRNSRDRRGFTPLLTAVQSDNVDAVEELLKNGVDKKKACGEQQHPDHTEWTLLQFVRERGSPEMQRMFA